MEVQIYYKVKMDLSGLFISGLIVLFLLFITVLMWIISSGVDVEVSPLVKGSALTLGLTGGFVGATFLSTDVSSDRIKLIRIVGILLFFLLLVLFVFVSISQYLSEDNWVTAVQEGLGYVIGGVTGIGTFVLSSALFRQGNRFLGVIGLFLALALLIVFSIDLMNKIAEDDVWKWVGASILTLITLGGIGGLSYAAYKKYNSSATSSSMLTDEFQ